MKPFIHSEEVDYRDISPSGAERCETCGQQHACPVIVFASAFGWCDLWVQAAIEKREGEECK